MVKFLLYLINQYIDSMVYRSEFVSFHCFSINPPYTLYGIATGRMRRTCAVIWMVAGIPPSLITKIITHTHHYCNRFRTARVSSLEHPKITNTCLSKHYSTEIAWASVQNYSRKCGACFGIKVSSFGFSGILFDG